MEKVETKHDLASIITDELYKLYGIKNESELYEYLYVRCSVNIGKKKVDDRELMEFVFDELNITVYTDNGNYVKYKSETHNVYEVTSEFLENLRFRASLHGDLEIEKKIDDVYKKGYYKAAKYRKLRDYKDYIKYNRLLVLNEMFGVTSSHPSEIKGFVNDVNHNPFKRSLEEILETTLSANRFLGSQTTAHITEEQLEDYLIDNIELIEEGMRYIRRQVEVPGGIVDIVAMDKDNNICVIEIKIKEDKSIIWQAMHYPKEIQKNWINKKVRMITLAPDYSEHILKALKSIGDVEIKGYNIKVSSNKIKKLNIYNA